MRPLRLEEESKEEEEASPSRRMSGFEPIKLTRSQYSQVYGDDEGLNDFDQDGMGEQWEEHEEVKQPLNYFQDVLHSKYGVVLICERSKQELRAEKENEEPNEQEQVQRSLEEKGVYASSLPEYKKFELGELKALAGKFGLKGSLTKRDLVGSLEEIWKYLHEGVHMTEYERLRQRQEEQSKMKKRKKRVSLSQPARMERMQEEEVQLP